MTSLESGASASPGASRRRSGVTTTRRDKEARPAPDLVDRNFVASRPNQLWVADITFVPTASGFLYLAVVLDAWSRKVVGWSMANHLRTELVLDALEMAIGQRRSDGCQRRREDASAGRSKIASGWDAEGPHGRAFCWATDRMRSRIAS